MASWGSRPQTSWEDPKSLLGAAEVGPGSSEVSEMDKKRVLLVCADTFFSLGEVNGEAAEC